jgi:hypothetical protein
VRYESDGQEKVGKKLTGEASSGDLAALEVVDGEAPVWAATVKEKRTLCSEGR